MKDKEIFKSQKVNFFMRVNWQVSLTQPGLFIGEW